MLVTPMFLFVLSFCLHAKGEPKRVFFCVDMGYSVLTHSFSFVYLFVLLSCLPTVRASSKRDAPWCVL